MQRLVKFAYGASTAVTPAATYVAIPLTKNAVEANSDIFPTQGRISHLEIEVTALSTATSLLWFLAWDAAGDRPLTPMTTSTITIGKTTATKGGVVALISADYLQPNDAVSQTCYLIVKSDAGTPTVEARLFIEW